MYNYFLMFYFYIIFHFIYILDSFGIILVIPWYSFSICLVLLWILFWYLLGKQLVFCRQLFGTILAFFYIILRFFGISFSIYLVILRYSWYFMILFWDSVGIIFGIFWYCLVLYYGILWKLFGIFSGSIVHFKTNKRIMKYPVVCLLCLMQAPGHQGAPVIGASWDEWARWVALGMVVYGWIPCNKVHFTINKRIIRYSGKLIN